MAFWRADGFFRTLRFRLSLWNTVVLLLLVSGIFLGLRQALEWTLVRELDHLLAEDAIEVSLLLRSHYPNLTTIIEALDRKARSRKEDGWFVEIFLRDGKLYLSSQIPPTSESLGPSIRTRGTFSLQGWRILHRRLEHSPLPSLIIRVGASLHNVETDVGQLTQVLLVTGGLITVVAPLIGYFMASRATRPLTTILATTRQLHPDCLDERLPLRGSGDELDVLSETVNSFLDRLAQHLQQQREFVANAAHELRSPLSALRTTVEIALERERSSAEYRELLADVIEECTALGHLINQLLLLAESDAGHLHAGETLESLDELVRRSVEMFSGVAEQKGVKLTTTDLDNVWVRGRNTHLRQVIHNLLDNAIKFTPSGGTVAVAVHSQPSNGPGLGQAVLVVQDTGMGIPPEHLPRLFDRFYRVDYARQRIGPSRGGTGLGLCICQSIIHAYDGSIRLESALNQGTTVTVTLPAWPR